MVACIIRHPAAARPLSIVRNVKGPRFRLMNERQPTNAAAQKRPFRFS